MAVKPVFTKQLSILLPIPCSRYKHGTSNIYCYQGAVIKLKLLLDANQTTFMVFTRAKENIDYSNLHNTVSTVSGSKLERVKEHKYLGIWLDDTFTFNYHIRNLAGKLW